MHQMERMSALALLASNKGKGKGKVVVVVVFLGEMSKSRQNP